MTAPDHLDPYTERLRLRGRLEQPPDLVAGLLEDVARRCAEGGASLIGHVKAHARTAQGSFHCNLASIRSGAHSAGPLTVHPAPADSMDLDLAVLVYGLPRETVAALVEDAVEGLREHGVTEWVCAAHAPTDDHQPQE
ncbi:MAG: hypothetical protein KKA32_04050 [Actinobacteria bacterium]|nr:hypothetical protein [Actinomycetota bacterium]